jgi:hypothetical protein
MKKHINFSQEKNWDLNHSFNKYLLSFYCEPGIVLGGWECSGLMELRVE